MLNVDKGMLARAHGAPHVIATEFVPVRFKDSALTLAAALLAKLTKGWATRPFGGAAIIRLNFRFWLWLNASLRLVNAIRRLKRGEASDAAFAKWDRAH